MVQLSSSRLTTTEPLSRDLVKRQGVFIRSVSSVVKDHSTIFLKNLFVHFN